MKTEKNYKIKLEDLQKELRKVFQLGYGNTIELKVNGYLIPNFELLRFCIPTIDNLKGLSKDIKILELKINGEYYEILK